MYTVSVLFIQYVDGDVDGVRTVYRTRILYVCGLFAVRGSVHGTWTDSVYCTRAYTLLLVGKRDAVYRLPTTWATIKGARCSSNKVRADIKGEADQQGSRTVAEKKREKNSRTGDVVKLRADVVGVGKLY